VSSREAPERHRVPPHDPRHRTERWDRGRSQCARRAILALLPTNASNAIQAMRNVLHDDGNPEELARRELAELTTSSDVHVGSIADAIDPQITAEECADRGWPWKIFSACSCARVCMKRLAAHKPDLLDGLIGQLQTARAQAEADSETPRTQRAFKILVRSVWSKPMVGAESETLPSGPAGRRASSHIRACRPPQWPCRGSNFGRQQGFAGGAVLQGWPSSSPRLLV